MIVTAELPTSYNGALVILSVAVAMVSSFVALAIVPRIHDKQVTPRRANIWILAFGVSLGAGIWTMHFIAMLALNLPIPVRYDAARTLLSLAVGVVFSSLAATPLRWSGELRGLRWIGMGTVVGLGIAGMHYTGMIAMRLHAQMTYDSPGVAASILIAVAAASAALGIANYLRNTQVFAEIGIRVVAAIIMGLAVSAMHYTGMAAVHFQSLAGVGGPLTGLDVHLMAAALTVIAMLMQGGVLITATMDESNTAVRKELALKAHLSSLLNAIPDAVFSINHQGVIQHANPMASQLFGYKPEEWRNLSMHALVPEDMRQAHTQWVADEMAGKRHDVIGRANEVRGRRKNGTIFPCELFVGEFSENGNQQFIAVVKDISLQKRATAENTRLRLVVEQMPEGIFITDMQNRIEYANASATRITGIPADQLIGMPATDVYGEQNRASDNNNTFATLNQSQIWREDIAFALADGQQRVIERTIAPVLQDGILQYHVYVDTDVSEQRQMQKKMAHTQRLESLGVLAGGIAHDFNNILTAILGNAAMAERKAATQPQEMPKFLGNIVESSEKAADLCKQMLAYSGKGKFVVKPINLSSMVKGITKLLEVSISKSIVLQYQLAEPLPSVEADAAQIQQVIMNLVINASDAIGSNSGTINIATGVMLVDRSYLKDSCTHEEVPTGQYVFLEISDTGCGMDKQTQQRIFEPFFTTKFTGHGLGMSAVLGIVRGHHGAFRLYSEPGQGTTFKLLLPVSDQAVETDASTTGQDKTWHASGVILIVDDEKTIRETAAMMLQDMGFETLTAVDGLDGVDVYRSHQHEVVAVLLDMTMPKLDGKGCFRELRRINNDVKVILSSGYSEQEATSCFSGKGLAGFIQKPYLPNALQRKIRAVMKA